MLLSSVTDTLTTAADWGLSTASPLGSVAGVSDSSAVLVCCAGGEMAFSALLLASLSSRFSARILGGTSPFMGIERALWAMAGILGVATGGLAFGAESFDVWGFMAEAAT